MKKLILFLFVLIQIDISAGVVDTVSIPSDVMQSEFKAVIVLPEIYASSPEKSWPVVYLLHGWSGKYSDWIRKADLATLSDKCNFIIVCPDGGYAGWYLNSPLKTKSQYDTYIAREVVNYIDENYQTIGDSTGRFISASKKGGKISIIK